jgi:hypothetical protein
MYRRKAPTVQAHQSLLSNWLVWEGGVETVYDDHTFKALFEPVELGMNVVKKPDCDVFGFDYSWCHEEVDRALINELLGLEAISIDNAIDGQSWMFKPYPLSIYGKLLDAVVKDMRSREEGLATFTADAPTLLEVGCGIGTKLVAANEIFGFRTCGFDYNEEYVIAANELLRAHQCETRALVYDARDADCVDLYETSDVIYINRPFVHLDLETKLEHIILHSMHSGAYIVIANGATDAAQLELGSWCKVAEDQQAVVLRKP